ncbi:MAG: nucleotide-binding protein [Chloroflexi bacterium]|nr:nucleotide-binding protein [Chloroflexota bacterium]
MVTQNSVSSQSLLLLLVPRNEAEQAIRTQIEKGIEISNLVTYPERLKNAKKNAIKWFKDNVELVGRLFNDATVLEEYNSFFREIQITEIPFSEDYVEFFRSRMGALIGILETLLEQLDLIPDAPGTTQSITRQMVLESKVFIVHGHDEAAKESAARFVEKLGLEAIILHEQPNAGRTIIEKFEDHSNVGFAIVLLTPDDVGSPKDKSSETKPRARQNVILELGYFMGKLGRGRVCALYKEDVDIPSDYKGVAYISMDSAGAWRMALAKEIKNAGIEIDLNKVL